MLKLLHWMICENYSDDSFLQNAQEGLVQELKDSQDSQDQECDCDQIIRVFPNEPNLVLNRGPCPYSHL